eukprot:3520970-Pleurochrysis_carterae.AAC.2
MGNQQMQSSVNIQGWPSQSSMRKCECFGGSLRSGLEAVPSQSVAISMHVCRRGAISAPAARRTERALPPGRSLCLCTSWVAARGGAGGRAAAASEPARGNRAECTGARSDECTGAKSDECTGARCQECRGASSDECRGAKSDECRGAKSDECTGASSDECKRCRLSVREQRRIHCQRHAVADLRRPQRVRDTLAAETRRRAPALHPKGSMVQSSCSQSDVKRECSCAAPPSPC